MRTLLTADLCVRRSNIVSHFLLRTDDEGHRWEIQILEDGTIDHRREGRTQWISGWPPSVSADGDDPPAKGS
jgi:hypothetical protein